MPCRTLLDITDSLASSLERHRFSPPVACVYNPLIYAREPWRQYVKAYGSGTREVLLLGMNPGPYGMTQTGIPFGEVNAVRDWLGIKAPVGKPPYEHPKRPVLGFACKRSEVSGRRLWGWARERFTKPERFFSRFIVLNYCPLVFMDSNGRNLTPDKLPKSERDRLLVECDSALREAALLLKPRYVIGIGEFAEKRARAALKGLDDSIQIGRILHPSPANPKANHGWEQEAERDLRAMGVKI